MSMDNVKTINQIKKELKEVDKNMYVLFSSLVKFYNLKGSQPLPDISDRVMRALKFDDVYN